jgi:hypothetical protein
MEEDDARDHTGERDQVLVDQDPAFQSVSPHLSCLVARPRGSTLQPQMTSATRQAPTAKTEIAPSVVMFPSCRLRFGVPHLDLNVVQAIGEGEVLATLASEDGALRTPYRKRPAEYRPFSALFAG